jgi:hypothetical protein
MLFGTSGIGQQFTFSVVPAGQCPDVTWYAYRSRVNRHRLSPRAVKTNAALSGDHETLRPADALGA